MHYGAIKSREIDNQINCNLTRVVVISLRIRDQRTYAEWLFVHDVRAPPWHAEIPETFRDSEERRPL